MTEPTQVNVDKAENVNIPSAETAHPAMVWVVFFVTCGVLVGFTYVTYIVLTNEVTDLDAATKGALVQTWNNLAVAAAAVWTTSKFVVDKVQGKK